METAPPKLLTDETLSIVLQGPVITTEEPFTEGLGLTEFCVRQYRLIFPKAEIILSSWENAPDQMCGADKVLRNSDPGALPVEPGIDNKFINVNRQIVSTLNGLNAASREWALKTRTDTALRTISLLDFYNSNSALKNNVHLFERPVAVSCWGSLNPARIGCVYRVSDFVLLGLRSDLIKYWSAPLATDADAMWQMSRQDIERLWFATLSPASIGVPSRTATEQYLLLSMLNRSGIDAGLSHQFEASVFDFFRSERVCVRNFLFWPGWADQLLQPKRLSDSNHPESELVRTDHYAVNRITGSELECAIYTGLRLPAFIVARISMRLRAWCRAHLAVLIPSKVANSWRLWRYRRQMEKVSKVKIERDGNF
jgi:hypothetical protein